MSRQWCVIHSKPRQEQKALEHLQNQGFETWLPLIEVQKLKSGKLSIQSEPLFSRYLFIHLDIAKDDWASISSTRGVHQLVRHGHHISVLSDGAMQDLQKAIDGHEPANLFEPGESVEVISGAFKGLVATFHKMVRLSSGEERAMAFLDILGKAQVMSFDLSQVHKLH